MNEMRIVLIVAYLLAALSASVTIRVRDCSADKPSSVIVEVGEFTASFVVGLLWPFFVVSRIGIAAISPSTAIASLGCDAPVVPHIAPTPDGEG